MQFKLNVSIESYMKYFNKIYIQFFNEIAQLFHEAPIYCAVKKNNIEIVKILLSNDKIDINILYIFTLII